MRLHLTKKRVIDQHGNQLDDTIDWARSLRPETPRVSPAGIPDFGRQRAALVMRVPSAPRGRDLVRAGFAALNAEMNRYVAFVHAGWRKVADENDRRMAALDARSRQLAARVHGWAAAGDGLELAGAYAAAESTAEMAGLVSQVAERMLERSLGGVA